MSAWILMATETYKKQIKKDTKLSGNEVTDKEISKRAWEKATSEEVLRLVKEKNYLCNKWCIDVHEVSRISRNIELLKN